MRHPQWDTTARKRLGLHLQPGIEELSRVFQSRGSKFYLVSGGFLELARPIAKLVNFDGVHANTLEVDGGKLTGKVGKLIVDENEKKRFVTKIIGEQSFDKAKVVVVGDGANDRHMMTLGAMSFGFYPKVTLVPFLNGGVFQGTHKVIHEVLLEHKNVS